MLGTLARAAPATAPFGGFRPGAGLAAAAARGAATEARQRMPPPAPKGFGTPIPAGPPPPGAPAWQQQDEAAHDLETDDAPHERREEFTFADVLARVKQSEMVGPGRYCMSTSLNAF